MIAAKVVVDSAVLGPLYVVRTRYCCSLVNDPLQSYSQLKCAHFYADLHSFATRVPAASKIAFYAWGSYTIDQSGWSGFKEKLQKDFWSTYMAELVIWPAFQVRTID